MPDPYVGPHARAYAHPPSGRRDGIEISGLRKAYRGEPVLDGVDLTVRPGEYFSLVGVNGAGKTTLIKCLLDFTAVDAGTIRISGRPHDRPAARAELSFLPERFTPPYYLTGGDFLGYMRRLHGVSPAPEAVEETLAAVDLDPKALRKPARDFSKGMSQKLGLAACLLSGRPLLLLDEPMSGLDPKARALLKRHLLERRDGRQTLFFSTHLLSDVEAQCDRLGILHRGRLRFAGTPEECRATYRADDLEQAFLRCIAD